MALKVVCTKVAKNIVRGSVFVRDRPLLVLKEPDMDSEQLSDSSYQQTKCSRFKAYFP